MHRALAPMETVLPPFETVVCYHKCSLSDTAEIPNINELRVMHRFKSRIDCFHPNPGIFDGITPIRLLRFLGAMPFKRSEN